MMAQSRVRKSGTIYVSAMTLVQQMNPIFLHYSCASSVSFWGLDWFFCATSQRFHWHARALGAFLLVLNEGQRRGRLKKVMTVRFSTRLSSAAPSVLVKLMGKECVSSQRRRVAMSCSMAFIWKWVPTMLHTWNSWWLWPAEGAITLDFKTTVSFDFVGTMCETLLYSLTELPKS